MPTIAFNVFLPHRSITVRDLLYYFPRHYEDRSQLRTADSCTHGETASLRGRVLDAQVSRPKRGLTITKLALDNGTSVFYAVWFNQPFIKKNIPLGTNLYVTGKIERNFRAVQVVVEEYETAGEENSLSTGRLVPVYPLNEQLNQRLLRTILHLALQALAKSPAKDFLPEKLLRKYHLPHLQKALADMHYPATKEDLAQAKKRFIFEELFLYQLTLARARNQITGQEKTNLYRGKSKLTSTLLTNLPYRLTKEQAKAWREISNDLESPYSMQRLLQGDVGTGKTVLAVLALLKAVENNLQGALMAPTEILAEQHYLNLKKFLTGLKVEVALLTGGLPKKDKEELLQRVSTGEAQIVVGTHALLQEKLHFQRLGLIVVDEQHRFGVRQRATLQAKGAWPDTLVMTATPIPRTLALTLYGDLDVSVIRKTPRGRQPVRTYAVPYEYLPRVYRFIKEQIKQGRQAFIVCPLVEKSEKLDLQAAVDLFEQLAGNVFCGYRMGLLHGRLNVLEKEQLMAAFRQGEKELLICTTVIEVGVDVPNATIMVILDAERFGLAQLHQLRGRVGRGIHQSHCILVAEPKTEEGQARLKAMTAAGTDGFALAEEDLRLRGPGAFTGTRQSGLPEFKIANLLQDQQMLQLARQEALAWVGDDPDFKKTDSVHMLAEIKNRSYQIGNYIGIG